MFTGQQQVNAVSSALPSGSTTKVTIKALAGNLFAIFVGPAGATIANWYELLPGQSITISGILNYDDVFLVASNGGVFVSFSGEGEAEQAVEFRKIITLAEDRINCVRG